MSIFPQLVANSLIAASLYALVAIGFNLVYSTTKFFNLAHGSFAVVGGYTTYALMDRAGWPLFPSILVGIIAAALLGFILDKVIFLPLRKRKASNMVLLVASLGAFTVIQALVAIIFTSEFHVIAHDMYLAKLYTVHTAVITQTQTVMLVAAVLITIFLAMFLRSTRLGKSIKAVSDDEEVSTIIGIKTNTIMNIVFIIGAAIAGLAGILVGLDTGIEPTMGMNLLLGGVIAAIIGGIGNVYGSILGALLLGFAENFGIWKISGEWKSAIAFSLLILFLIFRPQGILKK